MSYEPSDDEYAYFLASLTDPDDDDPYAPIAPRSVTRDQHDTTPDEVPTASWAPEDISSILDGTHTPLTPTLWRRDDGQFLLYPARVHSISGESESGKSLIAQALAVQVLTAGGRAVYVDYESTAGTVVGRLLDMGAAPQQIRDGLTYIRPERDPLADSERPAFKRLLDTPTDLVVLDGVTEALSTMGLATNSNDDVTHWSRTVPKRIAEATGAAVVLIDHVTKSSDTRGRFAIGAQAKMSTLGGASYSLEVKEPIGRGMRGTLRLWIGKDREGAIRPNCGRWVAETRQQHAAEIIVDSTAGPITVVFQAPEDEAETGGFRPTGYMQKLSMALEQSPVPLTGNALTKDSTLVPGKKDVKSRALSLLVAEGYVAVTTGSRNSLLHTSSRPYRESMEPGPTRQAPSTSWTGSGLGPLREGDPGPSQIDQSSTGSGPSRDPVGPSAPVIDCMACHQPMTDIGDGAITHPACKEAA